MADKIEQTLEVKLTLTERQSGAYSSTEIASTTVRIPFNITPERFGRLMADTIGTFQKRDADLWSGIRAESENAEVVKK